MEKNNKMNVQDTYLTLKKALEDEAYRQALTRVEEIQRNYLKYKYNL